ncbi:Dos2-interacting transcription regulator of RNA-Pol-II-domain-containing protein [Cokeromyces recurvatus]|uniref:Dos2-interacting transcription regulator of RNA-Pol-II-domain-containing protein n=1 Tax=Cokeromyces recurvatus TaxID=90255 RepID=UPI00221E560F|nr:Dos2-interacting transcription regulator of RNA-Pol-II-domain-containing protein [Cokeromyces recurvatus]KAI7902153.1 Dos2-interacting transcription regulator of RNA-Pol-II-domain-containing protein [Cokeromyces recurvatus]
MDIPKLLLEWFSSDKTEVDPSLLAYILLYLTKNELNFADFIDYLVSFWEKGDATYKKKCVEILAQVVIPSQSSLDSPTINALVRFICERLNESTLTSRCIDILSVLMNSNNISSTDVVQICDAIFTHINTKKLQQQSRYKVLAILEKTLEKYASETQRSKINFIGGFINCMDGEKDPRNLMIAFELVRVIIDRFDISRHVEDLFDIVFCYFPISFSPPPNDPFGITTRDLKESLRRCLAATPYFAYYATPLLIEKLLTTTGSAKEDAMETIRLCAPAYGAHAILPHVQDLFDALVGEVYREADASMVHVALETIHSVVATLGTGISIANIRNPVEKAIESLLHKCVEELKEPELKRARSAASILRATASASDPACTSVTYTTIPILCEQYKTTDPIRRRVAILDILTELLMASKQLYGSVEDIGYDRDFQTPLFMFKQPILHVFTLPFTSSTDIVLHQASLRGIHEMVLMKQFLKEEEIKLIVDYLTQQLMCKDKQVRHYVLSTFGVISKLCPTVVGQHTIPIVLKELASSDNPVIKETYHDTLEVIQYLGVYPALFKIIMYPLLEKIDYACMKIGKENVNYVHDLVTVLLSIYKVASKDCEIVSIGQKSLLPEIIKKSVQSTLRPGYWYLDNVLVDSFAMIAAITTRLTSISEQQASVHDAIQLFIQGDFSMIDQRNHSITIFNNGSSDQNPYNVDITLLFTAIIGNCNSKAIQLPLSTMSLFEFLEKIISTAIQTSTHESKRLALSKLAASIINKWMNNDIEECVKKICSKTLLYTLHNSKEEKEKKISFTVLVWVIKALIIRGHKYGFELLDSVIEQCGTVDLGKEAAISFKTLLQEEELILNKPSHSNISILYKQRVFHRCFKQLRQGSEIIDICRPELQVNYLLALFHVLQNIPSQIAINEISKLMLPIIVALSSHDSQLIEITLNVVHTLIPNSQELVVQHLGSFIHALLRLSRSQSSVQTRIHALDCLSCLAAKGKPEILSPFKPSVVKELSLVLDDKKRIVRKNAVDCRERWYTIGK